MPSFKLLGLALLLLCGILGARFLADFERARCTQTGSFLTLVRHIRAQIACFSHPVSRILQELDAELATVCALGGGRRDLQKTLEGGKLFLPEDARSALLELSRTLGNAYREEQLRCCEQCIERLSRAHARLEAELERRVRLATLLPLSLAGAIALFLI